MTVNPAEKEAEAMFQELVNGMGSVIKPGLEIDNTGVLRGENRLVDGWDEVSENEATGYFYSFSGLSKNVGTAYAGGALLGGLHGVYLSLKMQRELAWKAAFPSMLTEATVAGTAMANRGGGVVFSICVLDAFIREMIIRNARKKYSIRKPDPEAVPIWERDSRILTPLTALVVVPAVRWKRHPKTIASSTLLLSGVLACYSHMWSPERYFDIRKAWDY